MEKLKRIYCENKNFDSILKEIKSNRKIAFKNDFDIEEYQNTLLEILEKRVSQKNLIDLQDDYRDLNKKIEKDQIMMTKRENQLNERSLIKLYLKL